MLCMIEYWNPILPRAAGQERRTAMIVVDANEVAHAILPGEHTSLAIAALERDPEWVAPTLWQSEVRNVLATTMRVKGLRLERALGAWVRARSLVVDVPSPADTSRVFRLAAESKASGRLRQDLRAGARLR